MFDTLKRIQLHRKGLSCGKMRRKHGDNEVANFLDESPYIRGLIFLLFAVAGCFLLISEPIKDTVYEERSIFSLVLFVVASVVAVAHLFLNHPRSFANNARFLLFFGAILLQLFIVKTAIASSASNWDKAEYFLLILPSAVAPLLLSVLGNRNLGLFGLIVVTILGVLFVPSHTLICFVAINMACGMTALFMTEGIRRRGALLRAGFFIGLIGTVFCWFCQLFEVPPTDGNWRSLWPIAAVPMGIALISVLLLGGILPLLESIFQSTTALSWIEASDLNHPLLRRLAEEAPGTYQHSLVVARLAESAAESIGANSSMCRACAYFHDIGKLSKPNYFIENIGDGTNPHDELTPTMSALIIIAHVKDGVHMALESRLKPEVIDMIEQHHGTSLVYSFYRKAKSQQEEIQNKLEEGLTVEEDVPEVKEESFCYPGPKPQFKESAILALADSVESASRSIKKPTPKKIRQLVHDIVQGKIESGQLDECDLTFQELSVICESFRENLRSMFHNRVAYPEKEKNKSQAKKEEGAVKDLEVSGASK